MFVGMKLCNNVCGVVPQPRLCSLIFYHIEGFILICKTVICFWFAFLLHLLYLQGTVIRVFSIPDGQKLFEFRRGVKRYRSLHSFLSVIFKSLKSF